MNRVETSSLGADPPEWADLASAFCLKALGLLGIDGWDLSVAFTDDASMRDLNLRFRGKDEPTDVLSFEQGERFEEPGLGERFLAGDIVISLDSLASNAREFSVGADEELKRLLVHGVLHLAGMDHGEEDSRGEMLERQEDLLSKLREERII
jgi:probable rRNA maturation factor